MQQKGRKLNLSSLLNILLYTQTLPEVAFYIFFIFFKENLIPVKITSFFNSLIGLREEKRIKRYALDRNWQKF
jgi:hypothetical protein